MFNDFLEGNRISSAVSLPRLILQCLAMMVIVGFFDYITGYELQFFVFYVWPIWHATWHGHIKTGLLFAIFSVLTWFAIDYGSLHPYTHPLIPVWNGLIRFLFFGFIVYSVQTVQMRFRLEHIQARYDGLTGILNRHGFIEHLNILYPMLIREKQWCSMVFVDVDRFKEINDQQGHAVGDALLKSVAELLHQHIRSSDVLGRLGGDEFVLFLPNTTADAAQTLIHKLKHILMEHIQKTYPNIGFSMGVYGFDSTTVSPLQAIEQADQQMYKDKQVNKLKTS